MVKANKDSEAGIMPTQKLLTEMGKFNEELVKAGVLLAAEGLQPTTKGKRVRFAGATRTVIDGPFTETKELIAGFWLWQVRSMEEAVEWVKRCPNPHEGEAEIEIRQVFEAEDFGSELTPDLRKREERMRELVAGKNSLASCRFCTLPFDVLTEPGFTFDRDCRKSPAHKLKQKGVMTMRFMMLVKHAEKSEAPPKEFIDAMTILAKRRSKPEPFAGVVD